MDAAALCWGGSRRGGGGASQCVGECRRLGQAAWQQLGSPQLQAQPMLDTGSVLTGEELQSIPKSMQLSMQRVRGAAIACKRHGTFGGTQPQPTSWKTTLQGGAAPPDASCCRKTGKQAAQSCSSKWLPGGAGPNNNAHAIKQFVLPLP